MDILDTTIRVFYDCVCRIGVKDFPKHETKELINKLFIRLLFEKDNPGINAEDMDYSNLPIFDIKKYAKIQCDKDSTLNRKKVEEEVSIIIGMQEAYD